MPKNSDHALTALAEKHLEELCKRHAEYAQALMRDVDIKRLCLAIDAMLIRGVTPDQAARSAAMALTGFNPAIHRPAAPHPTNDSHTT